MTAPGTFTTFSTTVTYLEMTARPLTPTSPRPAVKTALMRAEAPTASFYRYLYNSVGEDWLWFERRLLNDEDLCQIIGDERVEVYVLYVGGVPTGFGELDRRDPGQIELAYFGLLPEFIGRGLGRFFLGWLVDQAWSYEPRRLWLHTCDLDHPHAFGVYQSAGFQAYDRRTVEFPDPRSDGSFADWRDPRHQ